MKVNYPLVPVTCERCKHDVMEETSYSDIIDSYWLECPECHHEQYLHFEAYDVVMGYYDKE